MIGVAQRDRGDAVRLGAADRILHGEVGQHLAHRVAAVDHRHAAGIDQQLRRGGGGADAGLQAREVPGQAQHAVRLMAPQVGLYQRVGDQPRVGVGHSGGDIDRRREVEQWSGGDPH